MPGLPPNSPPTTGPNCYQCRHFAVSWDPKSPYACSLMGFKSRVLPAIEVRRIDGMPCLGFSSKLAPIPPTVSRRPALAPAPEPVPDPVPEWADLRGLSTFRRLA